MQIEGLVLAGGRSLRLGQDKATLRLGEKTLLEWQLARLRAVGCNPVRVSFGQRSNQSPSDGIIIDQVADGGPIEGIWQALAINRSAGVIVLAVDLPAMDEFFLRELWQQAERHSGQGIVPVTARGAEPLAAFYHQGMGKLMATKVSLGERSLQAFWGEAFQAGLAKKWVLDQAAEKWVSNINTMEEWYNYASSLSHREPS